MRPESLTVCGCRSYVQPQTFDLSGKDFVAVIGDTGSGKSSILDAICYALYNRPSWPDGSVSDLVADGGDGTLSVSLTFSVAGTVWRVDRSTTPRAAAPTHRLIRVDDGAVVATGARDVTAQIKRIIGMDYGAFLKSVMLPQGRFQELLRMGDTDRGKILKSILGLDQISTVRDHAQAVHTRLAGRLTAYRLRRGEFLADPGAALADAGDRLDIAQRRLDTYLAAQREVEASAVQEARAVTRQAAYERARSRLAEALRPAGDGRYHALLRADAEIAERRRDLDDQRAAAVARRDPLRLELDEAGRAGTGAAELAGMTATLAMLADQIPELRGRDQRLAIEAAAIEAAEEEIGRRRSALATLARSYDEAREAAADASDEYDVAARDHQSAVTCLEAVRLAESDRDEAEQRIAAARRDLEADRNRAQETRRAAETADADWIRREQEHAEALKAHAAVSAAEGSGPGDPCPVCVSPLPDDFVAPVPHVAVEATADAVRRAGKAAAEATARASTAAEAARRTEHETLATAVRGHAEAVEAVTQAVARAEPWFGPLDSMASEEELLGPTLTALDTADDDRRAAEEEEARRHDVHTRAAAQLPVSEQAITQRRNELTKQREEQTRGIDGLTRAAQSLPAAFRPGSELSIEDVRQALDSAQRHQAKLRQIEDDVAALDSELRSHDRAEHRLDQERTRRVTEPAHQLRHELSLMLDRAEEAAELLDVERPAPCPPELSLAEEAAWAATADARAQVLLDGCAQAVADAQAEAETARRRADLVMKGCDAESDDDLEQLVRDAHTARANASAQIATARAHRPLTDELDRRITAAAPTVDALADLVTLLADGKFVAEAVRRRQHTLLTIGHHLLMTISGGKLGFAANFQIIDTGTGSPRSVKTLSGGETFQASLALALAVVELAGRASGRVDALFLDEGFGTLDSGVLRDALNALAGHTTSGRMVTVISHMRAIAEIAEHVLVVERTPLGSRAHWAGPDEREQIINDDLGRGLLP
ncbi:AAA family ATPase [Cryptosporangium sp. NPDC051539]|uniref:AAA family ATPase n=1 Tax=Cryptosporangium sp. NPDC051539 TaxID=3363962 RepID=UPI003789872C